MIPAKRTYLLLLFGIAIAPTLAVISGIPSSIIGTLLFDGSVISINANDTAIYWCAA